jgi:hypothetical protein
MAAGVDILRWNGAAGAPTKGVITGINTRANAEDTNTTAGTNNPIQIPPSGTYYSYWVCTRLSVTGALPSLLINNLRWYTNGTNNFGTGLDCFGQEATTYIQAIGTPGQTGTQLTQANYASLTLAPVQVWTLTSAAPKALAGSITNTGPAGDFGSFFVYQVNVGATASPGATGQNTFTWKYDEQ